MTIIRYKYYAIDFDGTIIDEKTHELLPYAAYVINRIKEHGGEIAIWTCRTGEDLEEAVTFLDNHHIPYDCVNSTLPSFVKQWGNHGRKIFAEVYIDNMSIHCRNGIDWYEIEKWIFDDE